MKTLKTRSLILALALAAAPASIFAATVSDSKIEDTAEASYNFRTILKDHVDVDVDDGVVTLTGKVEDSDLKGLAEDTVRDIPGVVSVVNKIKVESTNERKSDGWIAFKAKTALLFRSNVSAVDTKIDVQNGVVYLTGSVDNAAQKDLTEAYVKDVEGVQSVKNNLMVKDTTNTTARNSSDVRNNNSDMRNHDRTMGEVVDDSSITAQVKYALLTHRSTSAIKTEVKTKDGVVWIKGQVKSDAEKDLVTKLARDIRGVKSVKNETVVMAN